MGRWLDRAPQAAFVVTSRERLHLPGEESFRSSRCRVERTRSNCSSARARAQRPDFALTDANRAAVAEVVRLLDGLPLAIELAAARVRVLSPAQIVERMRDRFALLAGARGAAARQATLRAAIDWSWDLLAPWEQEAFAQCSMFDGGFTLDAAEAVLDLSPLAGGAAGDGRGPGARGQEPAAHVDAPDAEPLRHRRAALRDVLEHPRVRGGQARRRGPPRRARRASATDGTSHVSAPTRRSNRCPATGGVRRRRPSRSSSTISSRRAAARCSASDGDVAVATYRAAWEVLSLQGPLALGITLGEQVKALPGLAREQHAATLATLAQALRRAGRSADAQATLDEALGSRARSATRGAKALRRLVSATCTGSRAGASKPWNISRPRSRSRAASAIATRKAMRRPGSDSSTGNSGASSKRASTSSAALAIARDHGDRREEGSVLSGLGLLCSEAGEVDAAQGHLADALAVAREVGDSGLEGVVRANLRGCTPSRGVWTMRVFRARPRSRFSATWATAVSRRSHWVTSARFACIKVA